MSMRYRGGYISATLPTVTGQQSTPGAWTLTQQMQYQAAGTWPTPPFIGWATYTTNAGSTNADGGAIVTDASGNVYVGSGQYGNYTIAKFDADGTKVWVKNYVPNTVGTVYYYYFTSGVVTSSGDIVMFGQSYQSSNIISFLMRITPDGNVSAARGYYGTNPSGDCYANGITIDASDNIYISVRNASDYHFIAKINPTTLAPVWSKYFGGRQYDWNSITLSPDAAHIYIVGRNVSPAFTYVYKFDTSGNFVQGVQYTITDGSVGYMGSISTDSDGNVYLNGATSTHVFNAKLNSSLQNQWVYKTPCNIGSFIYSNVKATPSGIYFIGNYGNPLYFQNQTVIYSPSYFVKMTAAGTTNFSNTNPIGLNNDGVMVVNASGSAAFVFTPYGSDATQYQKLPTDGSGLGIYNVGTSATFSYSQGPAFTSATASVTATTPTIYTPSVVAGDRTMTVTDLGTTFSRNSYQYPRTSGSALYAVPGTYTFIPPAGVTVVDVMGIGGGGGGAAGDSGGGGGGGGLGYTNNVPVTPGASYTVTVGGGGNGGTKTGSNAGTAGGANTGGGGG